MEVNDRLEKIEDTLARNTELLAEHMRRTQLLEDYVKSKDTSWVDIVTRIETVQERNQAFMLKLLVGIGSFTTVVIAAVVSLLKIL